MSPWFFLACSASPSDPPSPTPPAAPAEAAVRVQVAPRGGLFALVQLADRLHPDTVEVGDPATLARQPLAVRCDDPVRPAVVWKAMEVGFALHGWRVERDGTTLTAVPTEELWHGADRAIHLVVPRAVPAERLAALLEDHGDAVVAVDGALILGGTEATVEGLRAAVDALDTHPDLVPDGAALACPLAFAAPPAPVSAEKSTARVRPHFPEGVSLASMTKFFCDLRRQPVVVHDAAAHERALVAFRPSADLSVEDALGAYRLALGLQGWSLRPAAPGVPADRVERTGPGRPAAEVPVVAVLTVPDAAAAIGALRRDGADAGVELVAGAANDVLMVGGPAEAVDRAARALERYGARSEEP